MDRLFHSLSAAWRFRNCFRDYRPRCITLVGVIRWIRQFEAEDRQTAELLLESVVYLSEDHTRRILVNQNAALMERLAAAGLPTTKLIYVQVHDAGGSSPAMLSVLKDAAGLEALGCKFIDGRDARRLSKTTNDLGEGAIIYVDDFVASGKQFCGERDFAAQNVVGNFAEFLLVPSICEEALLRIGGRGIEPYAEHVHSKAERPLHANSTILAVDSKKRLAQKCREVSPKVSLGYDDLATMVVLYRNAPKTVPAILRGSPNQTPFTGVFPRTSDLPVAISQSSRSPKRARRSLARSVVRAALTTLALTVMAVVFLANRGVIPTDRSPLEVKSDYLGGPATHTKPAVVVFVHGLFGTKNETWMNQDDSFPAMLAADPEFHARIDIFLYEYFTPKLGAAPSIVALAGQLRGVLQDHRVFEDHKRVIFLSHSMGGIVVRQFLLSKHDLSKVAMLYFYATPTNGAEFAIAARELSSNPQLRGLVPLESNDLLQSIRDGWLGSEEAKQIPSYCAYETLFTDGASVVPESSAGALCNQPLDPLSFNHMDIVKPRNRDDPRYSRFATAMRRSISK
jgi:pimeloyl-ACP methyl ester carboxylesterase